MPHERNCIPRMLVAGHSHSATADIGMMVPSPTDRHNMGFSATFHESGTPVKKGGTKKKPYCTPQKRTREGRSSLPLQPGFLACTRFAREKAQTMIVLTMTAHGVRRWRITPQARRSIESIPARDSRFRSAGE